MPGAEWLERQELGAGFFQQFTAGRVQVRLARLQRPARKVPDLSLAVQHADEQALCPDERDGVDIADQIRGGRRSA